MELLVSKILKNSEMILLFLPKNKKIMLYPSPNHEKNLKPKNQKKKKKNQKKKIIQKIIQNSISDTILGVSLSKCMLSCIAKICILSLAPFKKSLKVLTIINLFNLMSASS